MNEQLQTYEGLELLKTVYKCVKMNLDFKPTSTVRMKKGKDLINFKDIREQKEDIERAFRYHNPYKVETKKSKLARAQYYLVLVLHTENHDKEGRKGWSHLIHYVQEVVHSRVYKWRNWEKS